MRCFYLKLNRHSDWVRAGKLGMEFRWEGDFPYLRDQSWAPPSILFSG